MDLPRHRLRPLPVLTALLACVLLLAACGGSDPDTEEAGTEAAGGDSAEGGADGGGGEGATFVYAAAGVPDTLDAWSNYQGDPTRVQMYEWNSVLVEYDPTAVDDPCTTMATTENVRPGLAESWEVAEDGTITFRLREGVVSPYGNELTADDVVWSLNRARELSPVVQFLTDDLANFSEDAFVAVDDHTVEVHTEQPTALDVSVFTYPLFTIHDSTYVQEQAGEDDPQGNEWLSTNTANFGPWVLESFEPGQEAVYSAHPDYWNDEVRGNISDLVIRNVDESSTRMQLIQTGEADYAERLSFQEYADLQETGGVEVLNCISPNRDTLMLNNAFEPFTDPEIRRAISMAIDREALVQGVYLGFAEASTTGMSRIYLEDTEGAATFSYDPDAAREVLEGQDLSFAIMTSPTRPGAHAESLGVQIQSMLSDVGANAEIDLVAGSTEFSDRYFAGEYEAVLYLEPPALGDPYYSANLYNTTVSFQNSFGYSNADYDELALEIAHTDPGPERQEAIRGISDLIVEDVPQVYLVERSYNHAFAEGISGYLNNPHGQLLTYVMSKG